MVAAPPPNLNLDLNTTEFVVLLGPRDGTVPALEDEVGWLYPIQVSRTANGRRDDSMTFGFNPVPRIVDTTAPVAQKRQIELRALDDQGNPTIVLGWGVMASNPQRIDEESETLSIEVRILDTHFGIRATSYPVWDPVAANQVNVMRPIVFNPEVDGVIRPNMDSAPIQYFAGITELDLPDIKPNFWIDPESTETVAAQDYQEGVQTLWTIRRAIFSVCWLLNAEEEYILNPMFSDLQALDFFDGTEFKNIHIPFGASLPEALDAILIPLEFGWFLEHSLDEGSTGESEDDSDDIEPARQTKIRFYRRGVGDTVSVGLQRPIPTRKIRDTKKTNVTSFDVNYSLLELANRIQVYGEFEKRESTFALQKGWDIDFDNTALAALTVGSPLSLTNPEIGRLWIFNEDGTYIGVRPELTVPGDLSTLGFSVNPIVRRRRFLPCISTHGDADKTASNQYRVDWYDKTQAGAVSSTNPADPGWVKVKWPFQVLEKQMGILFEGDTPPGPLWALIKAGTPNLAKVRITATVAGDQRLNYIATRNTNSPNLLDMPLVLDMREKFQSSLVRTTSIFSGGPSAQQDDTAAIEAYATAVQEIEDVMRLDCSIELEGCLQPDLQIGDVLPVVKGRNLGLILNASGRAPQIIGFNINCQGQRCELLLESFKKERPQIIKTRGTKTITDPFERMQAEGQPNPIQRRPDALTLQQPRQKKGRPTPPSPPVPGPS